LDHPQLTQKARLFNSPRFSDITVKCGERAWPAHKLVLCTQSDFFARACEGEFKVSHFCCQDVDHTYRHLPSQESQDNVISLHDDHPDAVQAMLRHFYTFDYSDNSSGDGDDPPKATDNNVSTPLFHVRVYAVAEKYLLEHLRTHAASKFAAAAKYTWATPGFADAVAEAYATIHDHDAQLRIVMMEAVIAHAVPLFDSAGKYEHFYEMAHQVPAFAAQAAELLSQRLAAKEACRIYKCPAKTCCFFFLSSAVQGEVLLWHCPKCDRTRTMAYELLKEQMVELPEKKVIDVNAD